MDLKKKTPSTPIPIFMLPTRDFRYKESERMEKDIHATGNQKKAGIDFKTKTVIRDKDGHYIMINGCIQQEEKTFIYPI